MNALKPLPQPEPPSGIGRVPVGRWFLVSGLVVALILVIGIVAIVTTLRETERARISVVDVIDPAAIHTLELATALQAQEGAVRSYAITTEEQYHQTYLAAIEAEKKAAAATLALIPRMPEGAAVRAEQDQVTAAAAVWRHDYAEVVAADVPKVGTNATNRDRGKINLARFAAVRAGLTAQQQRLNALHDLGRERLQAGWRTIYATLWTLLGVVILAAIGLTLLVRFAVLRPVRIITAQVRSVSGGDFDRTLRVERPAEFYELAGHADAMRRRILAEWRASLEARQQLDDQASELRRSNAELEQFAYVASHDLQEPLRKVASFTQMLEQRYGDQLDERAKQYIMYAVDGARRMQLLINDLLDFSRVGRVGGERVTLDAGEPLRKALANLEVTLEDAGATVTRDEMPTVVGNNVLLIQLFQNLIGNAVKFRSDEAPVIHIGVKRAEDGMWEFSCSDNGIGVDQKYADRIFLIFQRLHARDVYPGTGIGLALCRKIVEYHGGRIWLDAGETSGATFRWTLPGGPDDE